MKTRLALALAISSIFSKVRPVKYFILLLTLSTFLQARTWTDIQGRELEADFVRMEGAEAVVLLIKGKEVSVPIERLSPEDRTWLETAEAPEPKEPGEVSLLGQLLNPGRNVVPVDMTPRLKLFENENREHSKEAEIIIYLPDEFDPTQDNKILFTSMTASGNAKEAGSIWPYGEKAAEKGWVVIVADAVAGRPPEFEMNYRLQMLDMAFDTIHEEWPESTTWKVAGAGFSGGAKSAQILLMYLGSKDYGDHDVVGLILTGCNQCTLDSEKKYQPSRKQKRRIGVYFLQGIDDKIAPPEYGKASLEAIEGHGIKTTEYVEFEGRHAQPPEEIEKAITWLTAHVDSLEDR